MRLFPISRENIFRATTYTMLVSATCHLLTCLILAVHTGNPDIVNMFNIIGVSQIFPALGHGTLACLCGVVFVIVVGAILYGILQNLDTKPGWQKRKRS